MGNEGKLLEDKGNEVWNSARYCNVEVYCQKVEVMKYLGAMISSDGSMDSKVKQRIGIPSKLSCNHWENSAGVEGTGKRYKSVSGQCYGDAHLDIWL